MDAQLDFFTDPDDTARRAAARRPRSQQLDLETADGLVPDDEGLLARVIKPHSIEKAHKVGRFAETVSVAVARRMPIYWVEFFSGPGRLLDKGTGKFLPGSPMEALGVKHPFAGYFFADLSDECVSCLRTRTRGLEGVHVHQGDANDPETLDVLSRIVPRNALVIAYLDPQGLDLHLDTIRALAFRYRKLDLLINLPVNGLVRYLGAGYEEKATRVLGHPDPLTFMKHGPWHAARDSRTWYRRQLEELGYRPECRTEHTIRAAEKKATLYDLVVAGRHPLAKDLFNKASAVGLHGERQLNVGQ